MILILQGNQNDITLYDIPLYTAKGEYKDGERNTFNTDYPEGYYYFIGKTGPLQSGIYDISVEYYTYQDYYSINCSTAGDGRHYPAVYQEMHTLNSLTNHLTYRIWVNGKLDNVDIRISCGTENGEIFEHNSAFYVESIKISRDYRMSVLYRTLKLFTLLLLMDGALFVIWNRKRLAGRIRENFYVILGLACIFMVSSSSLMGNFSVGQHDLPFHYSRIIGLAEGLMAGSFPVKIQPGWLWGYGYAASVCYGDALLYFPAVLYMLGVPIIHAYKLYILAVNVGTLLISYYCYKGISRNKYVGVTCAALYCLSITRILNVYLRTAVGEYSAFMFLPLILSGIRQIYLDESESFRKGGLLLCLGMTGVIQTHVISTEMSCIFIALAVLLMIRKMTKRVFMAMVKSVLSALCLNLWFLLPIFDYSTDTLRVFSEKKVYGIQQAGLSIYELLSFGSTGVGVWKESFRGLHGRIPESLGIALLMVLLLAVTVAFKCQQWETRAKREFLLSGILSGTALWMSTYYFPYNRIAAVPGARNVFTSVQFPWRFLSIAVPLLTWMAGIVLVKIGEMFGKQKMYAALMVICMAGALQTLYCIDTIQRSGDLDVVYYDYRANRNHSWITSTGEYLLTGTDTYQTGLDQNISGENILPGTPERNGTRIEVSCQAAENARITFPLFAYKYYQCTDVETRERFPISRGENNRIEVELPDYYQGTLKVCFVEPWYWRAAEIVSLITLVWLIVYIWRGKVKKQNG